jgi:hypothetical protein
MAALVETLRDRRAGLAACAAAGVLPLAYWLVADLSRDETSQQHDWFFVLLFSAVLLAIGLGMLTIASQLASTAAIRTAIFLGVVLTAASLTNIVEDGFRVEPAFLVFVAELVFLLLGCLVLALLILVGEHGSGRLWAAVPIATILGILLFVELGGPLLAVTWAGACVLCGLRQERHA